MTFLFTFREQCYQLARLCLVRVLLFIYIEFTQLLCMKESNLDLFFTANNNKCLVVKINNFFILNTTLLMDDIALLICTIFDFLNYIFYMK